MYKLVFPVADSQTPRPWDPQLLLQLLALRPCSSHTQHSKTTKKEWFRKGFNKKIG